MTFQRLYKDGQTLLMRPVDAAPLAVFRIVFGLTIVILIFAFRRPEYIQEHFITPNFFFSFALFDGLHLQPLAGPWMFLWFLTIGIAGIGIMLGLFYRFSLSLFLVTLGYIFLLDRAYYDSFYYLLLLLAFLLLWMGGHHEFSLDALRNPARRATVPLWNIFLLRAQFIIVYFFAGVGKFNWDWLNTAQMRVILGEMQQRTLFSVPLTQDAFIYLLTYGGLVFDLSIGFLLCYKPTRYWAMGLAVIFHLLNNGLFQIGVFPFAMIAFLVIFADPQDVRRLGRLSLPSGPVARGHRQRPGPVMAFIGIYLLVHLFLPLRHWLYPGDVNWTEQGQHFAWRLFPAHKIAKIKFSVEDQKQSFSVDPYQDLSDWQVFAMSLQPDLILQYVHYLKDQMKGKGMVDPVIKVDSEVALNGRDFVPLIDKNFNMATVGRADTFSASWILPAPD